MNATRLLLVDDHQLILDSLQSLFGSIPNVEIVGKVNDSRQVLNRLTLTPADIIVCDLHMPYVSGIELAMQLRQSHPHIKVLLLTMAEDTRTIREAIRIGAAGYMLKRSGRDELEKAIVALTQGKRYFSNDILELLADEDEAQVPDHTPLATLTDREMDVLRLIADENQTQQIAQKLFISVPTVETHRRHLMQKLGVKSVVGMVKFAMRYGLVS